jgi:hypothetical protein
MLTNKKTTLTAKARANARNPTRKDCAIHEHHGNGNGVGVGLLVTGETLHPETVLSDSESHEHEGLGSPEVSYIEEPPETTDEASVYDHEEAAHSPVDQEHVEEPEELFRSHSPESVDPASDLHHAEDDVTSEPLYEVGVDTAEDGESEQERMKDDIADIVGLLESTSFTSKNILQGPDEGVVNDLRIPGSDKERLRIGEIPDEE